MINIILVNYKTYRESIRCVNSILRNQLNTKYEITIINNLCNFSNNKIKTKITCIKNIINLGFSKSCNQGAKIAKGKYLLFLNPDTIIKPRCIEEMIKFLDKKKDAAVVGCKILNLDRSIQPSCGNFPTITNIIFDRLLILNKLFKTQLIRQDNYYSKEQNPDWVSGAFFLVKKDIFLKLGGFDEKYFMYVEDVDFCYRARKAGHKIYYNPKAEIIHYDMGKSKDKKLAKAINMRKGFSIFFNKYHSNFYGLAWEFILIIESIFRPKLRAAK